MSVAILSVRTNRKGFKVFSGFHHSSIQGSTDPIKSPASNSHVRPRVTRTPSCSVLQQPVGMRQEGDIANTEATALLDLAILEASFQLLEFGASFVWI